MGGLLSGSPSGSLLTPRPRSICLWGKESWGQEVGTAGVAEIPGALGGALREPAQIPARREVRTRTAADLIGCDL